MTETESDEAFLPRMRHEMEVGVRLYKPDIDRLITLARRGAAVRWRPISEAPKDGTKMLLKYQNVLHKWRTVKAFYAPKLAIEQNDDGDGWCEYDEANDRFCLPEGWYECIENWDDYSYVHMNGVSPTHFIPLTALGEPEHE